MNGKIKVLVLVYVMFAFGGVSADNTTNNPPSLLGRWEMVDSKFYFSDGTITKSPLQCWMEFKMNEFVSECLNNNKMDRAVYAYQMLENGKYEAKVKENNNFPHLVGTSVKSDFRIENGKLTITSYPPNVKQENVKMATKVESTYLRGKKN